MKLIQWMPTALELINFYIFYSDFIWSSFKKKTCYVDRTSNMLFFPLYKQKNRRSKKLNKLTEVSH